MTPKKLLSLTQFAIQIVKRKAHNDDSVSLSDHLKCSPWETKADTLVNLERQKTTLLLAFKVI